ncbi:gonadotropin subunit beta-1-like [Notothenia coriiceps]|uniref:Gonadotropin subunit beta-1-like n=1 Tax=Notothenia coriiceps TaxID=8208 RepID=A0A6I9P1X9_9TELE|nr:PREDICTED: gonadotropin subunit beta-1-like [Notothenia coriiceps]
MMQLVVMAAVLALAGAGQPCRSRCYPTTVPITVRGCGIKKEINTTICVGQCPNEDSFLPERYVGPVYRRKQETCNGDWSYEVTHIDGCAEPVSYPVASKCYCKGCVEDYTSCKRYNEDLNSCLSNLDL